MDYLLHTFVSTDAPVDTGSHDDESRLRNFDTSIENMDEEALAQQKFEADTFR